MNMNSKQYIKTVYLLLSLSVQYEYEFKTVYQIIKQCPYHVMVETSAIQVKGTTDGHMFVNTAHTLIILSTIGSVEPPVRLT